MKFVYGAFLMALAGCSLVPSTDNRGERGREPSSAGAGTDPDYSSIHPHLYDHYFFKTETSDLKVGSKFPAKPGTVKNGEAFGIRFEYAGKSDVIKVRVELDVPSSPENFPCPKCASGELKISGDRSKVILEKTYQGERVSKAFYWGIDEHDPRGKYRISLSLDDVPVDSYSFEVK